MSNDTNKPTYLIYTDLDGTLLDHNNYSFAPAKSTLKKLCEHHFPVIPNTSKTKAELIEIRHDIGLRTPFIIENGAAVYIPAGHFKRQPSNTVTCGDFWVKSFAPPQFHWLEHIKTLKHEFGEKFIHFDEMTVAEIQAVTNLSEHNAQQAKQREYGEPVLWLADDFSKHNFVERLEEKGAKPIQGGRFLHISGATDKGQAMKWLTSEYQKISQHKYLMTIALGDGQNDIAMLEHADIAVRIASPANPLPQLNRTKDVYTSTAEGPDGWTESIEHLVFNHRF